MRLLTGHINFTDDMTGARSADVYDAHWIELTDEELNNFNGDWISHDYTGTINIITALKSFWE
jgi:hypothetical protein